MRPADGDPPLAGYATLMATFASAATAFGVWLRSSGRPLPERVAAGDLVLVTVATHKLARIVAKDRVTSVVRAPFTRVVGDGGSGKAEEAPRGHGLRRALGELVSCPYCIAMWIGAAFTAGLIVAPRATRWTATVLAILFGSDVLQIAYRRIEDAP
jgi:hypothetical protein